ncbi:MAG: lipoprotein [Nitrococcus mobilis]|nr:lipoprotein [Nitrococcus mobilis]
MLRRLAWIALLAALLLNTSCGLKGPLYLPDQPADSVFPQPGLSPRDDI